MIDATAQPGDSLRVQPLGSSKIAFDDVYVLGEEINAGAFGVVYKTHHISNVNETLAVKVIENYSKAEKEDILHEASIMKEMRRIPGVVQLIDFHMESKKMCIVQQLAKGGDVLDCLIEQDKYSEIDAKKLTKNLLNTMQSLHSKRIVHRDLKPENLLLKNENDVTQILLCDFGDAKVVPKTGGLTTYCGTPEYAAPEVALGLEYAEGVDMWSTGGLLFMLLGGDLPFGDQSNVQQLIARVCEADYDFDDGAWDDVSEDAKSLIYHLLKVDPNERWTATQALNHIWFKQSETLQLPAKTCCLMKTDSDEDMKQCNKTETKQELNEIEDEISETDTASTAEAHSDSENEHDEDNVCAVAAQDSNDEVEDKAAELQLTRPSVCDISQESRAETSQSPCLECVEPMVLNQTQDRKKAEELKLTRPNLSMKDISLESMKEKKKMFRSESVEPLVLDIQQKKKDRAKAEESKPAKLSLSKDISLEKKTVKGQQPHSTRLNNTLTKALKNIEIEHNDESTKNAPHFEHAKILEFEGEQRNERKDTKSSNPRLAMLKASAIFSKPFTKKFTKKRFEVQEQEISKSYPASRTPLESNLKIETNSDIALERLQSRKIKTKRFDVQRCRKKLVKKKSVKDANAAMTKVLKNLENEKGYDINGRSYSEFLRALELVPAGCESDDEVSINAHEPRKDLISRRLYLLKDSALSVENCSREVQPSMGRKNWLADSRSELELRTSSNANKFLHPKLPSEVAKGQGGEKKHNSSVKSVNAAMIKACNLHKGADYSSSRKSSYSGFSNVLDSINLQQKVNANSANHANVHATKFKFKSCSNLDVLHSSSPTRTIVKERFKMIPPRRSCPLKQGSVRNLVSMFEHTQ